MGLLTLLGLRRAPCDNCGTSSRLIRLVLPDGLLVSVCPACKTKFDDVFQEPLDDVEFSQLLKGLQISDLSVLGLKWGVSREVAEKGLRPDLSSGRLPGHSPSILSTVLNIGRAEAKVSFIFKKNALDHLMLDPRRAVLDAETSLVQLYGSPSMRMNGPLGPDETTIQWRSEGLEINLVETTRRIVNVIFYPRARREAGGIPRSVLRRTLRRAATPDDTFSCYMRVLAQLEYRVEDTDRDSGHIRAVKEDTGMLERYATVAAITIVPTTDGGGSDVSVTMRRTRGRSFIPIIPELSGDAERDLEALSGACLA